MNQKNASPKLGRPVDIDRRTVRIHRIMQAARHCFAANGFHAASTAEISKQAGISVANLYQYFQSKDDLMMALVAENLAADLSVIEQLEQAPSLRSGLMAACQWLGQASATDEAHPIRLEILAETFRRPAIAAAVSKAEAELIAAWSQVISRALSRGEISSDLEPQDLAAMLNALTDGLMARLATSNLSSSEMSTIFAQFISRAIGLGLGPSKED